MGYSEVARRILALHDREVRFHFADHFPYHDLLWWLVQAQASVTAPNGFKVPRPPELVGYLYLA